MQRGRECIEELERCLRPGEVIGTVYVGVVRRDGVQWFDSVGPDNVVEDDSESMDECITDGMDIVPVVDAIGDSPSRRLEHCVEQIALGLRDRPVVPLWCHDADCGVSLPPVHCAFLDCTWHGTNVVGKDSLECHLEEAHHEAFDNAETWIRGDRHNNATRMELYDAAIAMKESVSMPMVGCSIDRRAHRKFMSRIGIEKQWDQICAPVCFCCARIEIFDMEDVRRYDDLECSTPPMIRWQQVCKGGKFCGLCEEEVVLLLGMDTYLTQFGERVGGPNLRASIAQQELEDWTIVVRLGTKEVRVLGCPEDRVCLECRGEGVLCRKCELPVCRDCWQDLKRRKRPAMALANDLWTGYVPDMIYSQRVTYMELLCASVCHPTIMSIQYECYGWDLRREAVHMQSHRTGARGNFTAFHLPWEKIMRAFHDMNTDGGEIQLPRTGSALRELVQVVLMAGGADVDPFVISEATVRRNVVLQLIKCLIDRGHRCYVDIDFQKVEVHATSTLNAGYDGDVARVPPEVLAVLQTEPRLEERRLGKAAAPPDPLIPFGKTLDLDGKFRVPVILVVTNGRSECLGGNVRRD